MDTIWSMSANELAKTIRARDVSAVAVAETLLARIDALQPLINAVVQVAPDVLDQARQADVDLERGALHGPLHGVPFTVKDVFATVGLVTAIDTQIRRRAMPVRDATVVSRLRAAGGILLAKTNCPPGGSGSDTENAVSGRTVNPYRLDHSPGGSSGGEAALIAAGGSPFGLGSDLSGGLRVPAHYCGIAALKPTAGRIPNTGAYNQPGGLTDPRTQIGPLARRIDDLALVLPILAGPDNEDSGVVPMPWRNPAAVRLHTLRVAYFRDDPASPVTHETSQTIGAAAQALARAGVAVEQAHPRELIDTARQIDELWQDWAGSTAPTMVEAYTLWDDFRSDFLRFMSAYDALLCPVDHHPAPPFRARDPQRFDYTIPFSLSGHPCVVVRTGVTAEGLPVGVQIVAQPWREDVALVLARRLETELGGWQPVDLDV